jgi:hypothetical protein
MKANSSCSSGATKGTGGPDAGTSKSFIERPGGGMASPEAPGCCLRAGSGVRAGGNVPHTISQEPALNLSGFYPINGALLADEAIRASSVDATLLCTSAWSRIIRRGRKAAIGSHHNLPRRSSKALRPSEANAEPANFRPTSCQHTSERARIRFQERREAREGRQRRSVSATEIRLQSFVESGVRHSRRRYDARAIEGRGNTSR